MWYAWAFLLYWFRLLHRMRVAFYLYVWLRCLFPRCYLLPFYVVRDQFAISCARCVLLTSLHSVSLRILDWFVKVQKVKRPHSDTRRAIQKQRSFNRALLKHRASVEAKTPSTEPFNWSQNTFNWSNPPSIEPTDFHWSQIPATRLQLKVAVGVFSRILLLKSQLKINSPG